MSIEVHVYSFYSKLQCSHHADLMQGIHNVAVSIEKKMDALMSVVSEIKKKQNHLELALEMWQVCQPNPVTEKPRQPPAHGHSVSTEDAAVLSPMCYTPARDTPWYMSDSLTDHTPKAAQPVPKVALTTSSEAAFNTPSTAVTMAASKSTPTALRESALVTTPTTSTKADHPRYQGSNQEHQRSLQDHSQES